MKIDYNGHNLALTQLAGFDAFPGATTQLMCLQLTDKYFIKVINVTENFNKFGFNIVHGFFFFGLCGYN